MDRIVTGCFLILDSLKQCCGSINISDGSGSAEPDPVLGGQLITDPAGFGSYLDILCPMKKDFFKKVANHETLLNIVLFS